MHTTNFKSRAVERLPLRLIVAYLTTTVAVFAVGPFDWPVENWGVLLTFLGAVLLCLMLGFRMGVFQSTRSPCLVSWRRIFYLGTLSNVIVSLPVAYAFTGKMPWDVVSAFEDQGGAYLDMLDVQSDNSGNRFLITFLWMLAGPLVFSTIPLGLLNWRQMNAHMKLLFFLNIAILFAFSLLRGTDRESAELVIVFVSTLLVKFARRKQEAELLLSRVVRRYWPIVAVLTVGLFFLAELFIERREERIGDIGRSCIYVETQICADYNSPFLMPFDERGKFAVSMFTGYLSNGYYGLSLALEQDFESTYGIGHSPFIAALYARFTGDEELYKRSFMYKLRAAGWDDRFVWSTMFPWFASDISFFLVPLLMGFFAWMWGASWGDAVLEKNDLAAIVFVLLMIMMFYMPANSQLTLSVDSYFAFVCWGAAWLIRRRVERPSLHLVLPPQGH